jgi:hypothetical protein
MVSDLTSEVTGGHKMRFCFQVLKKLKKLKDWLRRFKLFANKAF